MTKFQSFDNAWGKPSLPAPTVIIEKPKEEVKKERKLPQLKKEELIIIGLGVTCFFLFMWALSATIQANKIARLHSQLLNQLILNLTK